MKIAKARESITIDLLYKAINNVLYTFTNLISSCKGTWQTSDIQTDSSVHCYKSGDTHTLHVYGNEANFGNGNISFISRQWEPDLRKLLLNQYS